MSRFRRRSYLGLICSIIGLAAGCVPQSTGDGGSREAKLAAANTELSIMSFNIRYGTAKDGENAWLKRKDLVFNVFRKHQPDIVGVQEALRFQLDEIAQALPEYGEIGVGRADGKTKGEYAAILYRTTRFKVIEHGTFWFSDTPEAPGSKSWGNNICRICTWARLLDRETEKALYIYNVHLDHQSQPSRERSVELLALRIESRPFPGAPVIITGDFNAAEDNPAIRYLKGEIPRASDTEVGPIPPEVAFLDTFRVAHPHADKVGTFNGFEGRSDGGKIDFVFVEQGIEVLSAEILRDNVDGRYPSDHFPVVAKLRLK